MLQRLVGVERAYRLFISDYLVPKEGDRILDVGCGPANILTHLPYGVVYTGLDTNEDYILAARARFGVRGTFVHGEARAMVDQVEGPFDVVMAFGLLHHLEDPDVEDLLTLTREFLGKGGRAIFIEPCHTPNQSSAARWFIARDRGTRVRRPEAYAALAKIAFSDLETEVRTDLVYIPWTHCILTCKI